MADEFPVDIVVRSSAAESAVGRFDQRLDKVEANAAEINRQMKLVVDNTAKLGNSGAGASKLANDLNKVESEAKGVAKELQAVQKSEAVIGNQGGGQKLATDLKKIETPAGKAADALERVAARAGAFVIAAAGAALSATVVGIIKQGDAYAQLEDRIRRATAATGDFVQVRNGIFDIAFQSGQSVETVNKVFESINRSRNELNASTDDILKVTRAVQQLGVISGASRTETQNALRQLSQGFSSDILRAEEFNSILENTPEIAFRIADGMDISLGTLQSLVRDGKVLSADVFASILEQSEEINKVLEDTPVRLERAYAQLGQSVDALLAATDASIGEQGLSGSIAEGISKTASLIQNLAQASNQLHAIQSNLSNQLADAQRDLAELQAATPLFYKDRHEAQIRATEGQITALQTQIETQKELDRVEREAAARKQQELTSVQNVAKINENIDKQTKALSRTRDELATATERLFAEEQKRNDAIENNPLGATLAEREELLERSRQKRIDGIEALAEREVRAEEQAANKVFQIRLSLADESEKLILREDRRQKLITSNVSDVTLRDELLLESALQLEEELDAIEQRKADKQAEANQKFLDDLLERGEREIEQLRELNEQKRIVEEENELRALEGKTQAVDLEDLIELERIERHEAQKQAVRDKYNKIALRSRQITTKFEEQLERNKTSAILGLAADLSGQLAGHSKTFFEINKAAGIANAIINTAQGVTEALKLPFPLNIAAAAATAAVGIGEIATIRATSYSGGGGSSGGYGGGIGSAGSVNIPDALTVTGDTQTEANTTSAPTVIVQTQAIFTNDAQEMQEVLGPAALQYIQEETTEGDATAIQVGSRQQLDLTG